MYPFMYFPDIGDGYAPIVSEAPDDDLGVIEDTEFGIPPFTKIYAVPVPELYEPAIWYHVLTVSVVEDMT
jgi:hypothetical protein